MLDLPPDEQIAAETSVDDVEVSANEDVNIASCEVRLVGWLVTRSASPNDRPTSLEASQCRKSNTIFSYFVGLGDQVYMGRLCIPFNPPQRGNSLKYFTERASKLFTEKQHDCRFKYNCKNALWMHKRCARCVSALTDR